MTKLRVLRKLALCALGGGVTFAFAGWLAAPLARSAACPDDRPGLWLRFVAGQPYLSGRAPNPVKIVAMESAVSFWGYPRSTVCSDGNTMDDDWMRLTEAVYRAPLAYLRTGQVLVRPDLVVIAGQASTGEQRDEIESTVARNLAAAGLAWVPTLVQIGVTTDPAMLRRLAALELRFPQDSAELPEDASHALVGIAQELRRADAPIIVIGHADAIGPARHNDDLSQRRADAVRAALVKWGVAQDRITARGEGDRMPAADNATAAGRAANRRVTIELGAVQPR